MGRKKHTAQFKYVIKSVLLSPYRREVMPKKLFYMDIGTGASLHKL